MRDAIRSRFWEVVARLDAGDVDTAAGYVLALHAADQADVLAELDEAERELLLTAMPPEKLALVFEHLEPAELDEVRPQLEVEELAHVLEEADADAAVDILHTLDADDAAAVLDAMEGTEDIEPLLAHEDESAGGIMSPYLVTLRPDMTTDNVLDYLRAVQPRTAEPYYLYVVSEEGRLAGVVGLRDLVVARPTVTMRELMSPDVITTSTETDQEEVLRTLQHYNLSAIPVVDSDDRLVGVTTADDLLDVAEQEATEDMFRMVGMEETESLHGPVPGSVRRRLPWLLFNLLTVFAAAGVVAIFEDTLDRAAALAIFLPVVVAISANAGGQTLTLVVRGMALGSYTTAQWRPALAREVGIGVVHGVILGVLVALVAWAWKDSPYIGVAIGVAMLGNLVVAALAGVLVPSGLRLLRLDPALASTILVTSVTDLMGFFLYLGVAALLIDRIA